MRTTFSLRPHDEAPFEARRAMEELEWLAWPPERMYGWCPPEIAHEFGTSSFPIHDRWHLVIHDVAARLTELGRRCVRDDDLVATMYIR